MKTCDKNSSTIVELSILLVSRLLNFGQRLKDERVRLGFSQADFGDALGVTKTTQFNYEKGARNPDAAYLAAAAELGVDVLYVLTGQRTPRLEEGLSEREQAVLDNFRALPEEDKSAVQRLTHALKESQPLTDGDGKTGS